jgi:GST-like protein
MTLPIQLYSLATPNGQKVSIALEEMKLAYKAHTVNILKEDQFEPWFIKINPNSKIPAIVDPDGPKGEIALMESGAILNYLARKSGQLIPEDPALEHDTLQWLFFQMASIGPMFGQFGHFYKYAQEKCQHPYPVDRYTNEVKRLLGVLDQRLKNHEYLAADQYTIADIATFPWVAALEKFYKANDQLNLHHFKAVEKWGEKISQREAVKKGMEVCPIPES